MTEKTEFGLGFRILDFPDAFARTPESEAEFIRIALDLREQVMWTATQRELTEMDSIVVTFTAVPTK